MLSRFAGICTLPASPYVILATSRLFSVCNAMNLTDPAVQHNAWLLVTSILGECVPASAVSFVFPAFLCAFSQPVWTKENRWNPFGLTR
jgi:hypothetical protein